eukprot:3975327-Amphidinium_carterae.2
MHGGVVSTSVPAEDITRSMQSKFWETACALDVCWHIDRVSTDANPADGPSRGSVEPLMALRAKRIKATWVWEKRGVCP